MENLFEGDDLPYHPASKCDADRDDLRTRCRTYRAAHVRASWRRRRRRSWSGLLDYPRLPALEPALRGFSQARSVDRLHENAAFPAASNRMQLTPKAVQSYVRRAAQSARQRSVRASRIDALHRETLQGLRQIFPAPLLQWVRVFYP